MSKFYHVVNCNRTIKAGDIAITFTPYEHTSCWLGVYEATDPKEIAALDELVKQKKIDSITMEEYNVALKKKKAGSSVYNNSLASSSPSPNEAAHSVEQSVETSPAPVPVETSAPLESVNEAVEVVKVESKKKK